MALFYLIRNPLRSFFLLFLLGASALPLKAQVPGNSLSYNGVDQFTTLPANLVQSITQSFTIEAWIYYGGGSINFPRLVELGWDTNHWIAFAPAVPASGFPRFGINDGGFQYVEGTAPLTTNAWHHLAVSLDDATNTLRLFVDGQLVATNTSFTHRLSSIGATSINYLGKSQFPTDAYFLGVIDEFRISNTVRYTADFTPHTTPHTLDANTVAYYRFEEGTGQTTADASGNNAAATLGSSAGNSTNDPAWTSPLPVRLRSFGANAGAQGVVVSWTALLEGASLFEVQRSTDGTHFSTIANLPQAAATAGDRAYTYTDARPLQGKSFYRLKYAETGGPTGYSKIVAVSFEGAGAMSVYPQPARSGWVNINLQQPVSGQVRMQVFNLAGALVQEQVFGAANQAQFRLHFNSATIRGSYLVCVQSGSERFAQVVVVE